MAVRRKIGLGNSGARARESPRVTSFIGAWGSPDLGTHAKAGSLTAGRWPCWPRPLVARWAALGLHWPERMRVRVVLGRAYGLGPVKKDLLFFFEINFQCENNSRKNLEVV
jgi:hypothetical protein